MNRRQFGKIGLISTGALLALKARMKAYGQTNIQSGIMQPVLTRGYDNARTGYNSAETILTQSAVTSKGIKKIFSLPMEGDARGDEAQTLILPSLKCDDGTVRDIAVCAAMTNDIGVFDANDSDYLWMKKLAVPINGSGAIDAWKINDHWGILSTPVIDPDTQYLYCVAWTSPTGSSSSATYAMHVIDLKTGLRVCPPVSLQNLTYTPANGKTQTWKSIMRKQRSSLLLTNINNVKTVFFASGTIAETSNGAAGWICAFDVMTNAFVAQMTTTSGNGGGIWMGGGGLCADSKGNLYCQTGNGDFDGVNDFGECVIKVQYSPRYAYIPANGEVGPGYHDNGAAATSLKIVDWWCPWDDAQRLGEAPTTMTSKRLGAKLAGISAPSEEMRNMVTAADARELDMYNMEYHKDEPVNGMKDMKVARKDGDKWMLAVNPADAGWSDEDLGSGGLTIFEDLGIVLACGKDGIAYLVNMNNMGKTKPADLVNPAANYAKLVQVPQWFTYYPGNVNAAPQDPSTLNFMWQGKTRHMHSTPASFTSSVNGRTVFCWGENSPLRAWKITKTGITFLAQGNEVASANVANSPGGMPGGFFCISSNGTNKGTAILVACIPLGDANKTVTQGRLLVYDAENFVNSTIRVLWDSQQWNITYMHNKFNPPVVSGGKIFIPTYSGAVDVYSLA